MNVAEIETGGYVSLTIVIVDRIAFLLEPGAERAVYGR